MLRLLSGLVLAAVFFALVWFTDSRVLLAVALGVAALAVHEYATIIRQIGVPAPLWLTLATTWAAVVAVPFPYVPVVVVLGVALMGAAVVAMWQEERSGLEVDPPGLRMTPEGPVFSPALSRVALATLAPVYIGLPLGALVAIHAIGGREAVVLLLATIVVSDTAQYYTGRLLGRRPLAPRLSPKKTVEGAAGGFVLAPAFLALAAWWLLPLPGSPLLMVAAGLVLVAAGIVGDLFESMLKRAAQLKDSSALIPGHGGVLDRLDALLFATPVFYLLVRAVHAG